MIINILNHVDTETDINDRAKPYIINKKKVGYASYIYTLNFNTLNEFEIFIDSVREESDICFVSKNNKFEISGEVYDVMTFNGYYE